MSHTLDNLKQAIERYEQLVGGKQLGPRRFYNYVLERARTSDLQGGGWLQNLFKRRSSGPTKNRYTLVAKPEPVPPSLPAPHIKPSRPPPPRPPPPRPPPPATPHETLAPLESPNIETYDPEQHGDKPTWAKSSLEYLQNRFDVHTTTHDMLKAQLEQANTKLAELGAKMEPAAVAKERQLSRVDEQKEKLAEAAQDVKDATLKYDDMVADYNTLDQQYTHLAHANQGLKREVDRYGAAVTEWRRAIFDFSAEHRDLLTPVQSDPAPAPADLLPDLDGSAPINQYKAYLEHTYLDESKWPPEEDWPVLADKYMAWRKSTQPGRKPPPFGYGGPGYVNPNRPRPAAPPPAPSP